MYGENLNNIHPNMIYWITNTLGCITFLKFTWQLKIGSQLAQFFA